ncbi:MAG: hypothetical protein KGJ13_10480 [Patescibacteria group bacterium]|nr:hypothetical protein [Patescibacteria group bacterium]
MPIKNIIHDLVLVGENRMWMGQIIVTPLFHSRDNFANIWRYLMFPFDLKPMQFLQDKLHFVLLSGY